MIKGYFLLLKLKYVTIIPYLSGIRKVSVLYILKVSLSKFARLWKTNNIFFPCLNQRRMELSLSSDIGDCFQYLVKREGPFFPAARGVVSGLKGVTRDPGLPLIWTCHLCHLQESQRQSGRPEHLVPLACREGTTRGHTFSQGGRTGACVWHVASLSLSPLQPCLVCISNPFLWTLNHPPTIHLSPTHHPSIHPPTTHQPSCRQCAPHRPAPHHI